MQIQNDKLWQKRRKKKLTAYGNSKSNVFFKFKLFHRNMTVTLNFKFCDLVLLLFTKKKKK